MRNPDDLKAKEVRFRFDDAAILAVATKLAAQPSIEFSAAEMAALAALRRAHPAAGQSNEELGHWLAAMNREQLLGVVSNTKGVLHEMLFVELENADGDTVFAAQFAETNNPGFDIIFSNPGSSHSWSAQLKATESEAYVREWLSDHPNDQILVTREIAARMGLESSGISNVELTADTNSLVSLLINAHQNDEIWDYLPGLSTLSVALVIWNLRVSVVKGEISEEQFRWMAAKASVERAARVLGLSALLSIPGVNILTGITLLARVLESSGAVERFDRWASIRRSQMQRTVDFEMAVHSERIAIEGAIEDAKGGRKTDDMLRAKGEAFRQFYEKRYSENKAALNIDHRLPLPQFSEYNDPDRYLPKAVGNDEIDSMVRRKVFEQQCKREASLNEARSFLMDGQNVEYFNNSLEELVGSRAAEIIRQAIFRV